MKLVIPEKLRDRVKPRRSLPEFVHAPTEKSAARELQRIAKGYVKTRYGDSSSKKLFQAGLADCKDKRLRKLQEAAHALLCAPSLDAVRATSLEVLAAADHMAGRAARAHLVDAVAVTRGVAAAVEMMALGLDLDLTAPRGWTTSILLARASGDHTRSTSDWLALRHIVCGASAADYAKAKAVAAAFRKKVSRTQRMRFAFAFPDESWTRDDIVAAKTPDDVDEELYAACDDVALARTAPDCVVSHAFDYAINLPEKDALALLGDALPPLLVRPRYGPLHKTPPREIATAIALFVNERAAKILAPYFGNAILGPIVAAYFQDHPELAGVLGDKAKSRLHTNEKKVASGPVAKGEDVPRVLRDRPWKKTSTSKPIELRLAIPKDVEERIELTDAERARSFEKENADETIRDMTSAELKAWHSELKKDGYLHIDWNTIYRKMGHGVEYARVPEDEGLRAWTMGRGYANGSYVEWLARHGTKAIEGFVKRDWVKWLAYTEVDDEPMMDVLAHIVSPRIAPIMARVVARRKNFRQPAMAWLMKYPQIAATGLVPDAFGKAGEARDDAELSLRQMAQKGARDAILAAAKTYGDETLRATDALVSRDPLEIEATVPKAPDFLRRKDLPAVTLKNGARLPDDAVDALLEMLRIAQLESPPYPGTTMLREACDEASLAAFARELAEQWLLAGANGRFEWMLFALGHFPSADNTRRAGQLARDWARRDRKKALRAITVLAAVGDDLALLHLGHVAATSRFEDLRGAARALLDFAAAMRGLARDELDDRIVPELDLSEIPFGARKLTVSLDEGLKPFIVGEKQFPRTKTAEEKAAKARYDALKADAAAIADRQIRRFEAAMVSGREWRASDFETYVAKHPLLRHLARRLVWESVQNATFRVAEDGTYADVKDQPVTLAKDARVRVVHPARMKRDDLAAWATLFADYKIAQPFEQLGRAAVARVKRDAFKAPARKVLGTLESRGWRRNDRAHVTVYLRALSSGGDAKLPISPGISMEDVKGASDQTIAGVELPQNAADPVDLAEITRDLDALL